MSTDADGENLVNKFALMQSLMPSMVPQQTFSNTLFQQQQQQLGPFGITGPYSKYRQNSYRPNINTETQSSSTSRNMGSTFMSPSIRLRVGKIPYPGISGF